MVAEPVEGDIDFEWNSFFSVGMSYTGLAFGIRGHVPIQVEAIFYQLRSHCEDCNHKKNG
jgi:hypothetical protein